MDGPVLSGGVIVLVAVLLWMLYLLPSWRGRYQYNAAERNAVRLNQALRVLAETSETPEEVRVELNTRAALAQQRLAKRLQAEQEAAQLEMLRAELAATRADPRLRQARARRRARLAMSGLLVAGLVVAGLGIWQLVAAGSQLLLWIGGAVAVVAAFMLQRMFTIAGRAAQRAAAPAAAEPVERVSPPLHDQGPAPWTPRKLPEPLTSKPGSRAQIARAEIEAQEARVRAARVAELRERARHMAAPEPVRMPVPAAASESVYAKMGFVDDAEIEDHVRQLLARRAVG